MYQTWEEALAAAEKRLHELPGSTLCKDASWESPYEVWLDHTCVDKFFFYTN